MHADVSFEDMQNKVTGLYDKRECEVSNKIHSKM
jgi:hypothetical protein